LICINGGSGTLMEIAMAYQAGIPIVVIDKTGGWSERLKDTFLDDRRRIKIEVAKTPQEAVELAINLTN